MRYSKWYWIGWLQGFADAEAYVSRHIPEIVISNTEKSLLEHCQTGLASFGIYSKLAGPIYHGSNPNAKPLYRLRIQRQQGLRDWARLIGFQHPAKRSRLQTIIEPGYLRRYRLKNTEIHHA